MNPPVRNIIIIWAGAAWLMTAATILESLSSGKRAISWSDDWIIPLSNDPTPPPFHIHIFEKNPTPGKKIIISGGWRCNLTTGITEKKELLTRYTRGSEFIKPAMGKFSPKKCREWFESHGVPLKCEADNRVFPVSNDGKDIVRVFERIFEKYPDPVTLHFSEGVSKVQKQGEIFLVTTPQSEYTAETLVITTGGNAYRHTGSSGDGYAFAQELGHTITQLGPSLSSFLTRTPWMHELSGLAFPDARISLSLEGKSTSLSGPLLLTHFGISGPLTFRASSQLAFEQIDTDHPYTIQLAPISTMQKEEWDRFLRQSFEEHPKKSITNILTLCLSRRFAESFTREYFSHLDQVFAASIGRVDREKISDLLGNGIPVILSERRPGDEFVTAGGVSTDEVSPESGESNIQKNLYFAGEVLDVDGVTGGFNLQACWASGYIVGQSIVKKSLS